MLWEYIGLTKRDRKEIAFEVNINCRSGGNRIWVKHPTTHRWDVGFVSYDRKGIIYYDRGWVFYPIVQKYPMLHRNLGGYSGGKGGLPFEYCLGKAIALERQVHGVLEDVESDYFVYRLHSSGVHSHGSDLIITKHKKLDDNVFENVKNSYCAIEVLGTKFYHGRMRFTYHQSKNFYKWMTELNEHNIMPIIAWIDKENNAKFMLLTNDTLIDVFYYENKKGELVQRTNYSPVAVAEQYSFNANDLMYYVSIHIKVNKIINKIDKNKPLVIYGDNKQVFTSPNWKCNDVKEYDKAIDDIKKG